MARFINPAPQFCDSAGDPIPGGKLYFYETGTTQLKDTWADVDLTTKNSNPVVLNGSGRPENPIFLSGAYRVRCLDENDVQVWEHDPVGAEESLSAFSDWNSVVNYNEPNIVKGSNDNYYISIIDANNGNDPTATPQAWTRVLLRRLYNANETYAANVIVETTDGLRWRSLQAGNLGNTPGSSPAWWAPQVREFMALDSYQADRNYSKNDTVVDSDIFYTSLVDGNLGNTPASSPTQWRIGLTHTTPLPPFGETKYSATNVIDVANGTNQTYTATANVTFSFNVPPTATDLYYFVLDLTDGDAYTITWPGSVTWADGVAPVLTAKDTILFRTYDNGTTWYGYYAGSIA